LDEEPISLGETPAPPSGGTAQAEQYFKESRDVGAIIEEVAFTKSGGLGSPREIKRLANLSRLYLAFREARREKDQAWQSPSVGEYARWIMIALRWPDMMRWLQWGADEATWSSDDLKDGLVSRRLKALEDQADTAKTVEIWRAAINSKLNMAVPEGSWVSDQKLLDFFKAEANLPPHDRLSKVIVRGFW
jgi:hypothetical protein